MIGEFFWSSDHFGWGLVALILYTSIVLCAADLIWRMTSITRRKILLLTSFSWIGGLMVILFVSW